VARRISAEAAKEVAALFEAEASSLFGYACTLPGVSRADAEDMVQVTFHEAATRWEDLLFALDQESLRKWLYRVLRYKTIDQWRKYGSRQVPLEQFDSCAGSAEKTYNKALSSITLGQCWEKIATMPETRQRVAFLTWSMDWSSAEIAEYLGIKPSTVRVHLKRARDELAAVIGSDASFVDAAEDPGEGAAS
jgi:RNA polymerase sigma-70 factor, ECF subfamily